ncbi:MAG: hypothetical protein PHH13_01045 [Candidatus Peribacteraceae bacterium]|nr:hypothetical protein [Candidatus Peribacteraceae bacterium]
MLTKFFVVIFFLGAQLIISWYGFFLGKIPLSGTFLGLPYASPVIGMFIAQIKYLWVPIIINMLYGLGFHWGNASFGNFLIVIALWIAAAPIAAVIFNATIVGEKIDLPTILGLLLVTVGSVLVIAHKEIGTLFFT